MNTILLKEMSPEKKTQKLDRLFRTCQEGFKQALRSLEARHAKTALGNLKRLVSIQEDIEILMLDKKRSLSIEVKIKRKFEELKKNTSAFQAAVELNSVVKDARAFSRWGIEYVSELAELD